jgi:hypothetical protein
MALNSRGASASAAGDPGGTLRPVSPTTSAASPTSVAMHGRSRHIASPRTLGKPSSKADGSTRASVAGKSAW